MKRVLTLLALVVAFVATVAAVEPSNIVVTVNGKSYFKHKVATGDTLYALSKAYNVSERQITDSNLGLTAETLRLGEYILIPRHKGNSGIGRKVDTEASVSTEQDDDPKRFIRHEVKRGETVYSIARRYKISVAMLEKDNAGLNVDKINPGDIILVRRAERGYASSEDIERERKERAQTTAEQLGEGEHRVVAGETVYFLSHKYGLSEEEFMQINGLEKYRDLKAGMVVRTVRSAAAESVPKGEERVEGELKEEDIIIFSTTESVAPKRDERRRRQRDAESVATGEAPSAEVAIIAEGEGVDLFGDAEVGLGVDIAPVEVTFPPLSLHHTLKVALMLPFHMNGKVNPYFVDFYRGLLLAMEDLKAENYDIELAVYDTCGDGERINDIVTYEEGLLDAQLIIGPVYEGELRYVLGYAEECEVPLVSPLADVGSLQSPVLFQMQADAERKDEKLAELFDGSRELVTIYTANMDYDYLAEVRALAQGAEEQQLNYVFDRGSYFYQRNADGSNGAQVDIVEFMRTKSSKAYVIASKSETEVDRILTTLASTKTSIVARTMSYGDYVVIGNRKWKQSANIEKQSFFRNNTIFISPYYANRSDENIRMFDSRYVKAYGVLPTMYAYRGYDAAMIFCRKMFTGIDATIFEESFTPLATTYRFSFDDGHYVNSNWIREHYKSDFTIVAE